MSDKVDGKTDGAEAGAVETGTEIERLANALRHEKAKNEVLLGEVIALEDEVVNRAMADYDAVVSDDTREFWREQLLTNRAGATAALTELARAKGCLRGESTAGAGQTRRPLHNRAVARPTAPTAVGGGGTVEADDRAAKIRNRAQEISRGERIPFSAAFRRAEQEFGGR
jgi:hypothetical protein